MKSDLYFILNPALGIIKIGISNDVEERRRTLEHGCGVPLEVLRVVSQGEELEQELHLLFNGARLMGEWFAPTVDLVELATTTADVRAYISANRQAITTGRNAREAELFRRKAEQEAAAAAEVDRAAKLNEEEKRAKKEREKAQEAAARKREAIRLQQRDKERAAAQADHDAMIAREWEHLRKLHRPEVGEPSAVRRHFITEQRKRNATLIGTTPIQNPNETQRPHQEGETAGVSA